MAEPNPNRKIHLKITSELFRALFLFLALFAIIAPETVLGTHKHFTCNGGENICSRTRNIFAEDWHENCSIRTGCVTSIRKSYACDPWQKCEAEAGSYMRCYCSADCLEPVRNWRYYDNPDPTANRAPQDSQKINLPVALVWDNIPGWTNSSFSIVGTSKNLGQGKEALFDYCAPVSTYTERGPKSYLIEIQDSPQTPGNGVDNMNLPAGAKIVNADGRKAFQKVMDKNQFNSRDDGGECFFNTNSTYRWRIHPCCDSAGIDCNFNGQWQTFTTSPAPEPLGITDGHNYNNARPAQDPDWNGKKKLLENVDFCSVKLWWCNAKLVENDESNEYSNRLNDGFLNYATNYQIRFKYNENWKLGVIDNAGKAYNSILNFVSNPSAYVKQTFDSLLKQAAQNIPGEDMGNEESCIYLQRKTDNNGNVIGCKPEPVRFGTGEISNIKSSGFNPSFSASEKVSDRSVFAGGLKYSWQTKTCFNSPITNSCDKYEEYNSSNYNEFEKKFGQRWEFSTWTTTIDPPNLRKPDNNPTYDNSKLVGTGDILDWSVPCGAHSFVIDIQKVNGGSIFPSEDINLYQGRPLSINLLTIEIASTSVAQTDPKKVFLELDTKYRWRLKSCWPSIPMGSSKSGGASNCGNWNNDWHYFYTTGQPPVEDSLKGIVFAPNVNLDWDDVSGARSYRIKIVGSGAEKTVTESKIPFTSPGPNKTYSWMVKACANPDGTVCGTKWAMSSFDTGDFKEPTNLSPSGKGRQLPYSLTWDSDANYFLVTASVTNGEKSTSCDPDWFNAEYKEKKVTGKSLDLKTKASGGSPYCTGNYSFKVQPCFNASCDPNSLSLNYGKANFAVLGSNQRKSGFMVCGQKDNDIDTFYNEKETCEIKHIFLTIKIIIDFIIFQLAFILLPILLVITGYFFYKSNGDSKITSTMKDAWKKIGIGYGFLFFAWIITSFLLQLSGYSFRDSWFNII